MNIIPRKTIERVVNEEKELEIERKDIFVFAWIQER